MNHLGTATDLEIGGKTYTLARFTRRIMRLYLDWADKVLPDPIQAIKASLDGFPPHLQELMVRDALDRSRLRRSFNSDEVQQLLQTPEGVFKLFSLLISASHPELTESQLEDLFDTFLKEQADKGADGEEALQKSFRPDSRADAA